MCVVCSSRRSQGVVQFEADIVFVVRIRSGQVSIVHLCLIDYILINLSVIHKLEEDEMSVDQMYTQKTICS